MIYDCPPATGAVRQGEILGPLWEHRAEYPPKRLPRTQAVGVRSIPHPMMVVLSPDCDLEQDFHLRFTRTMDDGKDEAWEADQHPGAVSHVLLCDLFSYAEIRPRFKGDNKMWRRVPQNQDERYHHFDAAPVEGTPIVVHQLYIDFKRTLSISTERLYDGVLAGDVDRVALVPPYYLHDLIQRFYGFLSRVALPD